MVFAVIGVRSEARTSRSSTLVRETLGKDAVSRSCAFSVKALIVKRAKAEVFIFAGFLKLHSEVPDLGGPNGLFHFLGSITCPGS
jgi:hypothetical protein